MKILLIGRNGQVGWELRRCLSPLGSLVAVDFPEIDLRDKSLIQNWITDVEPDVIVNGAAYTNVDEAEENANLAMTVNGTGPGILAEEAKKIGAALIHYSSDYVFDGTKGEPYVELDKPRPINTYGWSKLAGDQNIQQVDGAFFIFRTSWLYSRRVGCFVSKVLSWAREKEVLKIVSDQVGSPTWARLLAEATAQVLAKVDGNAMAWIYDRRGLYHLGGEGVVSRLQWAKTILKSDPKAEEQIIKKLLPAETSEFPTPAKRPLYTPLNCDLFANTFGLRLPDWEEALRMAMG